MKNDRVLLPWTSDREPTLREELKLRGIESTGEERNRKRREARASELRRARADPIRSSAAKPAGAPGAVGDQCIGE